MDRNYTVIILIEKYLYDIMTVTIMFIKTTFRNSKNVKRISNYELKCNLYLYFLILLKLLILGEKILMSVKLNECVT